MVFGIVVMVVYFGAIVLAMIQLARGRFRVDYDKMAEEAVQAHLRAKGQQR
jgi:hypothetical protein